MWEFLTLDMMVFLHVVVLHGDSRKKYKMKQYSYCFKVNKHNIDFNSYVNNVTYLS
jgi:hypothetical protein